MKGGNKAWVGEIHGKVNKSTYQVQLDSGDVVGLEETSLKCPTSTFEECKNISQAFVFVTTVSSWLCICYTVDAVVILVL